MPRDLVLRLVVALADFALYVIRDQYQRKQEQRQEPTHQGESQPSL